MSMKAYGAAVAAMIILALWAVFYVGPKDAVLMAASDCAQGHREKWGECLKQAEEAKGSVLLRVVGY